MNEKKTGLEKRWLGSDSKSYAEFQAENTVIIVNGKVLPPGSLSGLLTDAYTLRDKIMDSAPDKSNE